MPRPGPRPYECVRRGWHSDRHQPMRGTLIQEIFRVANEVHSPATRKNKEWQEKLPVVVLKAEEIMYSKANSEAEYTDPKTLWDRANDAIGTIIRKDDSPESGDFLQPCIEAALNLGCIPRRASRSQRHSNPGFYLSSSMREAAAASPKVSDGNKAHLRSSTQLLPSLPPHPSNLSSPSFQSAPPWYTALATPTAISSGCPAKVVSVALDTPHVQKDSMPFVSKKDSLLFSQYEGLAIPMGSCPWQNMGHVYPLYYDDNQRKTTSQPALQKPQDSVANTIAGTKPCFPSIGKAGSGFLQNFLDSSTAKDASNRNLNFEETYESPSNIVCDLTLRLGLPSPPSVSVESAWTHGVEDVGSSSSSDCRARDMNFRSSSSSPKDKGFDFFHFDTADEPFESCSSKGSSEGEGIFYAEASDKKPRAPIGGSFEDEYLCWKENIPRDPFHGRTQAPHS